MSSADELWVGSGVYKEISATFNMTSPVAETFIRGDITGIHTGDPPGEIIFWSAASNPFYTLSNGTTIVMNGCDNITFEDLSVIGFTWAINANTLTSQNITFRRCMLQGQLDALTMTNAANTPYNWTFDRCFVYGSSDAILILGERHTADYDLNIQIIDSVFLGLNASALRMTSQGAGVGFGYGVDAIRSTFVGRVYTSNAHSVANTHTLQDCLVIGAWTANASGNFSDLGGNIAMSSFTNVTLSEKSRSGLTATWDMPFSLGHEWIWGMQPRIPFSPILSGATGQVSGASVDMTGRPVGDGSSELGEIGTATAGSTTTLTDSGKTWSVDQYKGWFVRITGGTGSGQVKHISGNTATILTIGGQSGDWATNPDATSTYVIYNGAPAETGKATSGSDTTIVDSSAAWRTNQWNGFTVAIGAESKMIISNTATTLTTASWTTDPTANDLYSIYRGSGIDASSGYPGAFQRHDTADLETIVTDAGGIGVSLDGLGSHEFQIPVSAGSVSISVRARYDANHAATNKPQAVLLASPELGITTETVTMTSAADTWETLTFTTQTATSNGVVTVRLISRSAVPYGRAYFDSFAVS